MGVLKPQAAGQFERSVKTVEPDLQQRVSIAPAHAGVAGDRPVVGKLFLLALSRGNYPLANGGGILARQLAANVAEFHLRLGRG